MATSFERYKQRLENSYKGTAKSKHKKEQAIAQIELSFNSADGYFKGYKKNANSEWEEYDFLIKHTLVGQEKKVIIRPKHDLQVGTYLKYKPNSESDREVTLILRERILDDELMPSYKAYVCQDMLRLQGCPEEFPVYGFNSTYSSKGILDIDQVYTIDSRNKIYVQKNKYTIKLFEYHRNYRIILGSEETKYTYFITEMDDISYPGMFIISLKVDEKHPNDNGFYAYNERKIKFNNIQQTTNIEIKPLEVECEVCYQVGDTITIISSNELTKVEANDYGIVPEIIKQDDKTYTMQCANPGLLTLTIEDKYKNKIEKNIIVK